MPMAFTSHLQSIIWRFGTTCGIIFSLQQKSNLQLFIAAHLLLDKKAVFVKTGIQYVVCLSFCIFSQHWWSRVISSIYSFLELIRKQCYPFPTQGVFYQNVRAFYPLNFSRSWQKIEWWTSSHFKRITLSKCKRINKNLKKSQVAIINEIYSLVHFIIMC